MTSERRWRVTFGLFLVVLAVTVILSSFFDVNQFETVFLSGTTTLMGLAAWSDYRMRGR
ncbi:hypothetical protein [Rhizobium nepotum]|uniref:hypothetical protein n=1 Tax=Rhizobium nepotum TaxID=1035271 RepID=UPI003CE96106